MIEDPELRALFKAEGEEHLQILENGLLGLEADPTSATILEELFRSAHSLKGAARMLGVEDVGILAHHFEDELGMARRGHRILSAPEIERLYHGLDAMRRLVLQAVDGEPAQIDLTRVLDQLKDEGLSDVRGAGVDFPIVVMEVAEAIDESSLGAMVLEAGPVAIENFSIDTIRVEPQKLDALMTLAGEMTVTTARAARSLAAVDELASLWEEWAKARSRGTAPLQKSGEEFTTESGQAERVRTLLAQLARANDGDMSRLCLVAVELDEAIRNMRLLPISTVFNLFPRLVRDLSREQGKSVKLAIERGDIAVDKHLLEELKDPLMHLIRNAIDHGIELPEERLRLGKPAVATISLSASQTATEIVIEISDDGRGLDEAAIRRSTLQKHLLGADDLAELAPQEVQMLIFAPGFSTSALITDVSGRGVGLDVVRNNIELMKGSVSVHSLPGQGCTFRLQSPITLSTSRVLLVQVAQRFYALPVESIQETTLVTAGELYFVGGRRMAGRQGQAVPVVALGTLLELPESLGVGDDVREHSLERRPCVFLQVGQQRLGLFVDALVDEQQVLPKQFGASLKRVRNVSGSTTLGTGEICMVLNPQDLIDSARAQGPVPSTKSSVEVEERIKLILLAEDSITTRTQEKRILESAGYEVVTAVDGDDAFRKLSTRPFDALVSDIEMPKMSGLELAARIRQDSTYKELPIILVSSLASDDDRQRGAEVGANAYITKSAFDQTVLIETLRRLV